MKMDPITITFGALALAAAVWGGVEHQGRVKERREHQTALQQCSADLGECQAKETPETVQASAQGTTDALAVALAPQLGEVALRIQLVQQMQSAQVSEALVGVASPRLLAAEAAMARCAALVSIKDSKVLGCSDEVVEAWAAAVVELAACPEPVSE